MKELALKLKRTNKYANRRIADMIITREKSVTYGPAERKLDNKITSKLNQVFVKLLDDESRLRLQEIDIALNQIAEQISRESGWILYNGYHWEKRDNFQNMNDSEFKSFDTYRVRYDDKQGYTIYDEEPYNGYFSQLQSTEQSFMTKYRDQLQRLHELIQTKKKFMFGDYTLKDEANRDLADEICSYLGYNESDESKKVK